MQTTTPRASSIRSGPTTPAPSFQLGHGRTLDLMQEQIDPLVMEHWEGLATFGVVVVQLAPGKKLTTRRWDFFEDLHEEKGRTRLDLVEKWLKRGYGVGYLPRGGLYGIDCDVPDGMRYMPMYERIEDWMAANHRCAPLVETPSVGRHVLCQLPPDLSRERLKNHICHPTINGDRQPWDWKLYERTLMVGPGTLREKDGQLRMYRPLTPWFTPPVIDPRWIEPGLDLYLPENEPFFRDTRSIRSRVPAAIKYLIHKAPVAVSGKGGTKALRIVAEHLVAYYNLNPGLAYWLLTNPKAPGGCWNSRCRSSNGQPHPWTDLELMAALERAVDAIPAYGRYLHQKADAYAYRERCYGAFIDLLQHLPRPQSGTAPWMFSTDLLAEFVQLYDLDPAICNTVDLGRHLSPAIETERIPLQWTLKGHARLAAYEGVDRHLLAQARVTQAEAQRSLHSVS